MTKIDVLGWLQGLDGNPVIAIDDGGLTLREVVDGQYTDNYCEVGGCSSAEGEKEDDDPPFLEYGGRKVYHTMTDQDVLSDNFFAMAPDFNSEMDEAFDWRDLPDIPKELEAKYQSLFPETEANNSYEVTVCYQKQAIAYAIDLDLPEVAEL